MGLFKVYEWLGRIKKELRIVQQQFFSYSRWVNGDNKRSVKSKKIITDTLNQGEEIVISSLSAREISMLIQKGRLLSTMDVERRLDGERMCSGGCIVNAAVLRRKFMQRQG